MNVEAVEGGVYTISNFEAERAVGVGRQGEGRGDESEKWAGELHCGFCRVVGMEVMISVGWWREIEIEKKERDTGIYLC